MTPIGHFAVSFAAKQIGAKIHLSVLLAAAWLLDILYFVFAFAGIESMENISNPGAVPSPWSHGLLMAVVWSVMFGLLAWRVYHSQRVGLVIALVIFSHWVLDFTFWDNLYLFFEGSPQVGLGLFKALGASSIFIELGLFLVGIGMYWITRNRTIRPTVA
jgi:hypothetical protein